MRILVTVSPQMYRRQAVSIAILRHRPDAEVLIASPEDLDGQARSFAPHPVVRNGDGEQLDVPEGVVCWVGVLITDSMNARISVGGRGKASIWRRVSLALSKGSCTCMITTSGSSLRVVGDLPDDLHAPVGGEDACEPLAEHRVVVREQHPHDGPRRVALRLVVPFAANGPSTPYLRRVARHPLPTHFLTFYYATIVHLTMQPSCVRRGPGLHAASEKAYSRQVSE